MPFEIVLIVYFIIGSVVGGMRYRLLIDSNKTDSGGDFAIDSFFWFLLWPIMILAMIGYKLAGFKMPKFEED